VFKACFVLFSCKYLHLYQCLCSRIYQCRVTSPNQHKSQERKERNTTRRGPRQTKLNDHKKVAKSTGNDAGANTDRSTNKNNSQTSGGVGGARNETAKTNTRHTKNKNKSNRNIVKQPEAHSTRNVVRKAAVVT
jgi:hypothetical protein